MIDFTIPPELTDLLAHRVRALTELAVATRPAWLRPLDDEADRGVEHDDWTAHLTAAVTHADLHKLIPPGFTARVVSSFRPPVPIMALTSEIRTFRQLAMVWGVVPVMCAPHLTFEEMMDVARHEAVTRGIAEAGDRIIVTAGLPMHGQGATNSLRVEVV